MRMPRSEGRVDRDKPRFWAKNEGGKAQFIIVYTAFVPVGLLKKSPLGGGCADDDVV